MPSPPVTAKPYMKGVYVAYGVTSWCYFGVAFAVRPFHKIPEPELIFG